MIDDAEYENKKHWNTFRGWSNDGWLIKKGSKALKVNGKNLFHKSQVKLKLVKRQGETSGCGDWDDNDSWGYCEGDTSYYGDS